MLFLLWLYLATGVGFWLCLTGPESGFVQSYRKGELKSSTIVLVSFMAIVLWPRFILAMIIGR